MFHGGLKGIIFAFVMSTNFSSMFSGAGGLCRGLLLLETFGGGSNNRMFLFQVSFLVLGGRHGAIPQFHHVVGWEGLR